MKDKIISGIIGAIIGGIIVFGYGQYFSDSSSNTDKIPQMGGRKHENLNGSGSTTSGNTAEIK